VIDGIIKQTSSTEEVHNEESEPRTRKLLTPSSESEHGEERSGPNYNDTDANQDSEVEKRGEESVNEKHVEESEGEKRIEESVSEGNRDAGNLSFQARLTGQNGDHDVKASRRRSQEKNGSCYEQQHEVNTATLCDLTLTHDQTADRFDEQVAVGYTRNGSVDDQQAIIPIQCSRTHHSVSDHLSRHSIVDSHTEVHSFSDSHGRQGISDTRPEVHLYSDRHGHGDISDCRPAELNAEHGDTDQAVFTTHYGRAADYAPTDHWALFAAQDDAVDSCETSWEQDRFGPTDHLHHHSSWSCADQGDARFGQFSSFVSPRAVCDGSPHTLQCDEQHVKDVSSPGCKRRDKHALKLRLVSSAPVEEMR
jgi:hypothetical protein